MSHDQSKTKYIEVKGKALVHIYARGITHNSVGYARAFVQSIYNLPDDVERDDAKRHFEYELEQADFSLIGKLRKLRDGDNIRVDVRYSLIVDSATGEVVSNVNVYKYRILKTLKYKY
jgi:hypothetical protein